MGVLEDKAEQVRRLAEALCGSPPACGICLTRAGVLYDAGARIPDPPAPTMPVVSTKAIHTAQQVWRVAMSPDPDKNMADCLRAAWPIMLPDSVAALPKNEYGHFTFHFADGSPWCLSSQGMAAVLRALGAAE